MSIQCFKSHKEAVHECENIHAIIQQDGKSIFKMHNLLSLKMTTQKQINQMYYECIFLK